MNNTTKQVSPQYRYNLRSFPILSNTENQIAVSFYSKGNSQGVEPERNLR